MIFIISQRLTIIGLLALVSLFIAQSAAKGVTNNFEIARVTILARVIAAIDLSAVYIELT